MNITNMNVSELTVRLIQRMGFAYVQDGQASIVIKHSVDDWDLLTSLARNLSLVSNRWMENQEPRTTIYLNG